MTEREAALEEALGNILAAVKSHVDGRDLLDELHPRSMIDIKVRRDGRYVLYEGDWLSTLRDAVMDARLILDGKLGEHGFEYRKKKWADLGDDIAEVDARMDTLAAHEGWPRG